MKPRCMCGCGQRSAARHHVIYEQHLRAHWKARARGPALEDVHSLAALVADKRNLMPVAFSCHGAHHNGSKRLRAHMLPDSAFAFAVELMGAGAAHEYLARRYAGPDPRLDVLLAAAA